MLRGSVISIIINALFIIGSRSSMNANKYQLTKNKKQKTPIKSIYIVVFSWVLRHQSSY